MPVDFNKRIDRRHTNCAKWDEVDEKYHCEDLIHLGVADMDFQIPKEMQKEFQRIVEHGIFGYTNLGEEFYSSIQSWLGQQIGEKIPKEWIVYCPRINISGSLLVELFTTERDSVMIHSPYYMPLFHAIDKNGREAVESPLKWNGIRYEIDFLQMEEAVKKNTKMLILCHPHNPCTNIFQREELEALADFCIRHDLILVSDEIHSDIRREGVEFTSALNLNNNLKERLIYVNSPTKTFNIPGMILSYMVIPNEGIRNRVREEIDRIGMHNPNAFANGAISTGYRKCKNWLMECNQYIDENEDFVRSFMAENFKDFQVMPREGTFLLWIDCRKMGLSDEELEGWFIKEAKVGVYMGNIFGSAGSGFIRMNVAAPRALLEEALLRMKEAKRTIR